MEPHEKKKILIQLELELDLELQLLFESDFDKSVKVDIKELEDIEKKGGKK